eukprot:scaffold12436_cov62-Phaeocystis_antarctica.AAC.1
MRTSRSGKRKEGGMLGSRGRISMTMHAPRGPLGRLCASSSSETKPYCLCISTAEPCCIPRLTTIGRPRLSRYTPPFMSSSGNRHPQGNVQPPAGARRLSNVAVRRLDKRHQVVHVRCIGAKGELERCCLCLKFRVGHAQAAPLRRARAAAAARATPTLPASYSCLDAVASRQVLAGGIGR